MAKAKRVGRSGSTSTSARAAASPPRDAVQEAAGVARAEELAARRARHERIRNSPDEKLRTCQAKMARYWTPLDGGDHYLLPEIVSELRALTLSEAELRLLRLWLRGGAGPAGDRRAELRDVMDALIQEVS